MKEYQVSNHNLESFIGEIQKELADDKLIIVNSQPAGTGKWGMSRLWRGWMATTAKYMAGRGAIMPLYIKPDGSWYGQRPFDENDAHELFTRQHLGVDENGYRLSWAKSLSLEKAKHRRKATKGERFDALRKHEEWASIKGITLFKPRGSEYERLETEQCK